MKRLTSISDDPSQVNRETLKASIQSDLQRALEAATELSRYKWMWAAVVTQKELMRREIEPKKED